MLGTNKSLKWERVGKGILIEIPESIIKDPPCKNAWAFCIKKLNE